MNRDAEGIRLARRYYTTRRPDGKRWSFRSLALAEKMTKSRVAALVQQAESRGLVRLTVGTETEHDGLSLSEASALEEGFRRAFGGSVTLLDLLLVPRRGADTGEGRGRDDPCEEIGASAATRFIKPAMASSAVWTQTSSPSVGDEQPDGSGWGVVLAGGRTVAACVRRLADLVSPEAPAAGQVFGIGSCSGVMLREMQKVDPDACGLALHTVFRQAAFRPTMGALAPAADHGTQQPTCVTVIEDAGARADRRVMGLLGIGSLGSADCRLRAAVDVQSMSGGDVTLAGVRPDLDGLLERCHEYQELTENQLYHPVSDIANRLYTLRVPLATGDASSAAWDSPQARQLFADIERRVQDINERTLTYPTDRLARGCDLTVLMAGGTEKVGGIYWVLRHFPWQQVVLATDVATCEALLEIAHRDPSYASQVASG